ncbi:MAG: hypothetical protein ACJ76H_12445 [Bacteriovoracaceae bacterium]
MKFFVSVLALTFTFGAYAGQREDAARIERLNMKVKRLSMRNLSCRHDSDCTVLPVGSRACGGPSSFTMTSKFNRQFERLERVIARTTAREEEYNIKYHVVSSCIAVMPPVPVCENSMCKM